MFGGDLRDDSVVFRVFEQGENSKDWEVKDFMLVSFIKRTEKRVATRLEQISVSCPNALDLVHFITDQRKAETSHDYG